jgi:hypothetical protein
MLPASRQAFNFGDFANPSGPSLVDLMGLFRQLRSAQAMGSAVGQSVQAWTYVRPQGLGKHIVTSPSCDNVEMLIAGGANPYTPGQFVTVGITQNGPVILGQPPAGLLGVSEFQILKPPIGIVDAIAVTTITADPILAGSSNNLVKLFGYAFQQTPVDTFSAVQYDAPTMKWISDPNLTLHTPTWVSPSEVHVLADVGSFAPAVFRITVKYQRS